MYAKFSRRLLAYFIDIVILGLVVSIVNMLLPISDNMLVLNEELTRVTDNFLNNEINFKTYFSLASGLSQDLDKLNIVYTVINCIFIIIYFVIIPYFKNGQTLGKYLLKIRIVKKDDKTLTLNDLLIRNIIINGLGFMIICLAIIYVVPSNLYLIIVTFLTIIQILLVILTVFMILYRKDNCGFHDYITHTRVINIKEVEK